MRQDPRLFGFASKPFWMKIICKAGIRFTRWGGQDVLGRATGPQPYDPWERAVTGVGPCSLVSLQFALFICSSPPTLLSLSLSLSTPVRL